MKFYSYKKKKQKQKPIGDCCKNCTHSASDRKAGIFGLIECDYQGWVDPRGMACKHFEKK